MSQYPKQIYVRTVNPGTEDEFQIFGPDPADVSDTVVPDGDSLSSTVARYVLVGTGQIHHTAPAYVEATAS